MAKKKELQPKIVVTVNEAHEIEIEMIKPEYFNAKHMARVNRQIGRTRKIKIKELLREARLKEISNG